ncbi:hypothetical protein ACFFK7_16440 [Pseudoalteromonas xiamenensis]|uniref:hypothetical protein n=1 Tax=Pseudoalteromonas xiamenensis TaxID=882626 RepID=UPI0035EFEE9C
MSKPNKTGPIRTVNIICSKCKTLLFVYRKGGKGALVKCFIERINASYAVDYIKCPNCDNEFGRMAMIRGVPAVKIIGNKARMN